MIAMDVTSVLQLLMDTQAQNGSHMYGPHTIIINVNKRYTYVLYEHK